MKILIVECTAEELSANRTVMDTLMDTLNRFASSICRASISKDAVVKALNEMNAEDEDEDID